MPQRLCRGEIDLTNDREAPKMSSDTLLSISKSGPAVSYGGQSVLGGAYRGLGHKIPNWFAVIGLDLSRPLQLSYASR